MPQRTSPLYQQSATSLWGTQLHNVNSIAGNIELKNLLCNLYSCSDLRQGANKQPNSMPCPSARCVISSITRSLPVELSRLRQGSNEASCSKSSLAQVHPSNVASRPLSSAPAYWPRPQRQKRKTTPRPGDQRRRTGQHVQCWVDGGRPR